MTTHVIRLAGPRLRLRLSRLITGLMIIGVGVGLMLRSGLGVAPWDALHQGLVAQFGLTVGTWSIIVSIAILLAWLPLREPYGIGTFLDAVIVGVCIDLSMFLMPSPESLIFRIPMLSVGLLAIGIGSGLYLGAGLGVGSRDGLMNAISRRGMSLRGARVVLDVSALTVGVLLGGTFGVGTVAFAVLIGPLVQFFLDRFRIEPVEARR